MKYLALVVIVGLAVAAALLPQPTSASHGSEPADEIPPVAICPVVQAGGRQTDIAVLSSVNGSGRVSTFAAGTTGELDFRTGSTGAVTIAAGDAGGAGLSGALVEMPSQSTAAAALVNGQGSLAAESCDETPTGRASISGGSTVEGSRFEVELLNPYAGEANVDLTVTSDAGIESNNRFDAVVVPPLSTLTLDFTEIIGGRQGISVDLETTRGSVLAVGRQITDGRIAMWRAVAPGQDWWLPVPQGGGIKNALISSTTAAAVEYQIDLYGPDGLDEAYSTGTIGPRGSATIDLAAITEEAMAIRVVSTGPVVPTLWIDSPAGLAATTASQVDAPVWLLPGANGPAGGSGSLVILNSGLDSVSIDVRTLQEQSLSRSFELPAEDVLVVDLVAATSYRVEATGPVVALWTSQLDGAGTATLGVPIQDE